MNTATTKVRFTGTGGPPIGGDGRGGDGRGGGWDSRRGSAWFGAFKQAWVGAVLILIPWVLRVLHPGWHPGWWSVRQPNAYAYFSSGVLDVSGYMRAELSFEVSRWLPVVAMVVGVILIMIGVGRMIYAFSRAGGSASTRTHRGDPQ